MTHITIPQLGSVVQVDFGLFQHFGVITGFDLAGNARVTANSRALGGVAEQSWADFIAGGKVVGVTYPSNLPSHTVLNNCRAEIGRPWKLFTYNCEHFWRKAHGRKEESPQAACLAVATTVVAALFLTRAGNS